MTEMEQWIHEIDYCEAQLREATTRYWEDYWTVRLAAARAGLRLHIRAERRSRGLPVAEWDEPALITVAALQLRGIVCHE